MEYTFIKELGCGGFGKVSEVKDSDGNHFALKQFAPNAEIKLIIAKGHISEEDLKKRFYKEVKYQSKVNNPNVVRIIDKDLTSDTPWYVMDLAIGTLSDDLIADRTLGGEPKKALFDILSGLEAIHDLGIVHRDLKPVNILKFSNPEGVVHYAISDFGLITTLSSDTTTITKTGHGGGTQLYAAPELITNFKHATSAADIYSFGAILHDIFGGGNRTPYSQLTVPGPCRRIVEKCTYKNVARRYQDIPSLRADLFSVLDTYIFEIGTSEEKELIELLNQKDLLTDDEWDRFFEALGDVSVWRPAMYGLIRAVRKEHFISLLQEDPSLFNALGMEFSTYARIHSHDFNYCDILADKLEELFKLGSITLKAHCLLTFIKLGVSHNRWFVERKFLRLAGPDCDHRVIKRFLLEIDTEDINFDKLISNWEKSIGANRHQLHPEIISVLAVEHDN
jgi:serine/threonine protein kinase